jgi:hypothetical protein
MCNYIYQHASGYQGKPCTIQEVLDATRIDSAPSLQLPIDEQGHCLLHSNNIPWKRENGIMTTFLNILSLRETIKKTIPLSECVLCSNVQNGTLLLQNLQLQHSLDLNCSVFIDKVSIQNLEMPTAILNLNSCRFEKDLLIHGANVSAFTCMNLAGQSITLSGLTSHNQQAHFQHLLCEMEFTMTDCHFPLGFSFNHATFVRELPVWEGEDTSIHFVRVIAEGEADFNQTRFNGGLEFRNCQLPTARFIESTFSNSQPTLIMGLKIPPQGQWVFQGKSQKERMFGNYVSIHFAEADIQGTIIFQHANFGYIYPQQRQLLMSMEKTGKVQIGKGCIKYRQRTKPKVVYTSESNIDLFEDIARTFTSYFNASIGKNLGIEIVEKTEIMISYFYFTDEDLSVEDLTVFFTLASDIFWNIHQEKSSPKAEVSRPATQLEVDNRIDLFSVCLKFAARIANNALTKEDLQHIACITSIDDVPAIDPSKIESAANGIVQIVIQSLTIGEVKIKNIESTNSVLVIGDSSGEINYNMDTGK